MDPVLRLSGLIGHAQECANRATPGGDRPFYEWLTETAKMLRDVWGVDAATQFFVVGIEASHTDPMACLKAQQAYLAYLRKTLKEA